MIGCLRKGKIIRSVLPIGIDPIRAVTIWILPIHTMSIHVLPVLAIHPVHILTVHGLPIGLAIDVWSALVRSVVDIRRESHF